MRPPCLVIDRLSCSILLWHIGSVRSSAVPLQDERSRLSVPCECRPEENFPALRQSLGRSLQRTVQDDCFASSTGSRVPPPPEAFPVSSDSRPSRSCRL